MYKIAQIHTQSTVRVHILNIWNHANFFPYLYPALKKDLIKKVALKRIGTHNDAYCM